MAPYGVGVEIGRGPADTNAPANLPGVGGIPYGGC